MIFIGLAVTCALGFTVLEDDSPSLLKKIYTEVKELGPYPGDPFIRRDFHIGEGDDDTYKDIHVAVVIHPVDLNEKMNVQVAYMKRSPRNRRLAYFSHSKDFSCLIEEGKIQILSCDFTQKERDKVFSKILESVRMKKKLLRMKVNKIPSVR